MTIIRMWKGQTANEANAEKYLEHLMQSTIPALRSLSGFDGIRILRRPLQSDGSDSGFEFCVETQWRSLEAITDFAGDDIESAVVPPDAQAVLSEFDDHVRHFEVIHEGT